MADTSKPLSDSALTDALKPSYETGYGRWLGDNFSAPSLAILRSRFDILASKARSDIEQSPFWVGLSQRLPAWDDAYRVRTGFQMLQGNPSPPHLCAKSFDSFLLKTFRKNIQDNPNWPNRPEAYGWIEPSLWLAQINDIVRTQFIVKYLDGVEALVEDLRDWAILNALETKADFEARPEGYYAAHAYVVIPLELPGNDWTSQPVNVSLEMQITTQLKDVLGQLTHTYNEQRRRRPESANVAWEWRYHSDEFLSNYLGHLMHYLEGMIMEVRSRQEEKSNDRHK